MRKINNCIAVGCFNIKRFFSNFCGKIEESIKRHNAAAKARRDKRNANFAYYTIPGDEPNKRNYIFTDECESCRHRNEKLSKSKCIKINTQTEQEQENNPYYISSFSSIPNNTFDKCGSFHSSDSLEEEEDDNNNNAFNSSDFQSISTSDSSESLEKTPIYERENESPDPIIRTNNTFNQSMSYNLYYEQNKTKKKSQKQPLLNSI